MKNNTKTKFIVVLDDMKQRVDWLKGRVGDRATILWSTTVKGLLKNLKAAESRGDLVLVLLDHDLDIWSGRQDSKDKNGEDGTDAAKTLALSDKSIPITVWSVNGRAAIGMEDILVKRGFNANRMMYLFQQINARTIERVLGNDQY